VFKRVAVESTKAVGDQAEDRALAWLVQRGLVLVQRNYRVAAGPRARGGEIDLVMRERAAAGAGVGTDVLVFVEVRARASASGGALASVTATKRARIVRTAQHFLMRWPTLPPCRFDVVAVHGEHIEWIRGAFDAS
jgi:putative endonuclease